VRPLSATLEAAQKQASSLPYVRAQFADRFSNITRLRFDRHYTGSETDYYGAACIAGDGSLIRARIDPVTNTLYTQRVTTPGPGSTFSSWTSRGTVSSVSGVALAALGATVCLFYVASDQVTLTVRVSSNNGDSFGSPATVATAASAVTYLAAAIADSGDRVLLWTVGAVVWSSRFASSSWGTPAAWTNSAQTLTGLACKYVNDFNVVVCGTAPTTLDAQVWTCVYGDGGFVTANTWSTLKEVTSAVAGGSVSFAAPALDLLFAWRLFFVEKYSGSLAYNRLQWSTMSGLHDFLQELWREPAPFDHTGEYGVSAANGGGVMWLSSPAGVWSASSPAAPDLDVSADVVEATVDLDESDGRVRLVLRNDPASNGETGRYSDYGSGGLGALRRGTQLSLSPGYRTTAGVEVSSGAEYWVESIEQVTGERPVLVVQARDGWWLLEAWKAPRQFSWAAGTKSVSQLLQFVVTRSGLEYGVGASSSALGTLQPSFTIHPGESGKTAVLRLLAMVPDVAFMKGSELRVAYPQTADAVDYAFGTDHAIVGGRYGDLGQRVNRVRAFGSGVFDERLDFDEIESMGERLGQVHDLNLTTTTLAGNRAVAALRDAELTERRDEIEVFGVQCSQEVYDVVSVTDGRVGLDGAKRRVLGLSWRYATGARPRYGMTLRLGSA
jgi:hypothetical protein